MDRRKSIKALLIGTAAGGVLIDGCNPADKKVAVVAKEVTAPAEVDRMPEEIAYNKKLHEEIFFTTEESKIFNRTQYPNQ